MMKWIPFLVTSCLCLAGEVQSDGVNWPSFRGHLASGVAANQSLPSQWDGESGKNIKWKLPVDGFSHCSPIIWGDKLFISTVVTDVKPEFRHGLYGAGDAADDNREHKWNLICVDKKTGKVLWEKEIHKGIPKSKRHIKSTQNNATLATDGKTVIAFLGSEGLFAYDTDGNFKWKKDLGVLNLGAYDAPTYEWGPASSPIIYKGLVFVQCDTQEEDFLWGIDLKTGETRWKTARNELPSWGTPTVYRGKRDELITNSSNFIYGYNPMTGKELWRLGGSSPITAPTPVFSKDLIIVASGRRPNRPIFAIKPGASGNISLEEGKSSNDHVVWHKTLRGPYMPTPLIYQGYLYTLGNGGIFHCYELNTGKDVYRQRITHGGSGFSGSPVAADGKIFLPGEDGDIFVIKAGPEYKELGINDIGEVIMTTPAISENVIYVRARYSLFAIGK